MTQSFTCQNLTPQANYFSLSVSLVSSLLSSSLILSSAVQFFKTVRRKFRSAPVTTAKSPIVRRQMAVTKITDKTLCVFHSWVQWEDKIVCQLHFHCQGSLWQSAAWKAITFIRETYAWFEINSYCQANGEKGFFSPGLTHWDMESADTLVNKSYFLESSSIPFPYPLCQPLLLSLLCHVKIVLRGCLSILTAIFCVSKLQLFTASTKRDESSQQMTSIAVIHIEKVKSCLILQARKPSPHSWSRNLDRNTSKIHM